MRVRQVLDANGNRAREALRVLEECVRFVRPDAALTASLKDARHRLARALPAGLERDRDVAGDAGTALSTDAERSRGGVRGVAIAAGKRLGEALRVLEEFGKLEPAVDVAAVKRLRYDAYTMEQAVLTRCTAVSPGMRLCVLLTRDACRRPWQAVVDEVVAAGADGVQLREKGVDDHELLRRYRAAAEVVRDAATRHGRAVTLIMNDRADLAALVNADGVHLGQRDLPVGAARKLLEAGTLVGVSTHEPPQVQAAVDAGADYVGVGPMFVSSTKPRPPEALAGPAYLQHIATHHPDLPHLAIGGITTGNLPELLDAGVRGVAVSAAVIAADRPGRVVEQLLAIIP